MAVLFGRGRPQPDTDTAEWCIVCQQWREPNLSESHPLDHWLESHLDVLLAHPEVAQP